MAASRSVRVPPVAARAWRLLLDLFLANRDRTATIAGEFGLTLGDMKTLLSLDPDRPRPMGALAGDWKCDASNVTWLVDRLEERGLVERRTSTADRRVKTVVLTPAGETTKAALLERINTPPDEVLALPPADLEALTRALEKLADPPER